MYKTEQIAWSFVSLLNMRDPYTAYHLRGTADISKAIGERLGFEKSYVQEIYLGALLHDIGKNAIPSQLLSKPSALLPAEYGLIQTHVEHGWSILEGLGFSQTIADISRNHHERMDGSGYPQGLKAEFLSEAVRVVAVADSIHAMVSKRTYRVPLSRSKVISELEKDADIRLDGKIVEAACELVSSGLGKVTRHI